MSEEAMWFGEVSIIVTRKQSHLKVVVDPILFRTLIQIDAILMATVGLLTTKDSSITTSEITA